eukprot:ANDGO_03562.mRNA.1 Brix domain-containing protein F44G4.1
MPENLSHIRNKKVRSRVFQETKAKEKVDKSKERRRLKRLAESDPENAPAKKIPKTLDSKREEEITTVQPGDEEVAADLARDEYSTPTAETPKIMITTSEKPCRFLFEFVGELLKLFPNSFYYKRGTFRIKDIVEYAKEMGFTDLMVVTEYNKRPYQLLLSHLPKGPTATLRIRSTVLTRQIRGHGAATDHLPELILNRFTTRVGLRFGRMVQGLFPPKAQFSGRRVVTFHNQRDFLFVRHHRYIFEEDSQGVKEHGVAAKVRLQELGPRLTLKLVSIQEGTFDTESGEYEYVRKKKDVGSSRTKFSL